MRQRGVETLVHLMHREHTLSFLGMQSHRFCCTKHQSSAPPGSRLSTSDPWRPVLDHPQSSHGATCRVRASGAAYSGGGSALRLTSPHGVAPNSRRRTTRPALLRRACRASSRGIPSTGPSMPLARPSTVGFVRGVRPPPPPSPIPMGSFNASYPSRSRPIGSEVS